jgi:hypothetical protein
MALSAVSTRTRAEPRGIADHAIDRRPGPLPHRLSGALVAVGAIGSAVSVFHDPAVTADHARGTDLFLLAVAIPTLSCLDDPGGTRLHASTGCTARRSQLHRLQRGVLRLRRRLQSALPYLPGHALASGLVGRGAVPGSGRVGTAGQLHGRHPSPGHRRLSAGQDHPVRTGVIEERHPCRR